MISKKHDKYILLKDEHNDIEKFAPFLEGIFKQFEGENIIVDLLQYKEASLMQLVNFLELSNQHRATRQSFVLVNDALSPDDIPEELMVVPTLQEAEDVIEMEEIERDLGF
ncbi:ribonuclease Z [Nonlabens xiamenensis]|uniref:ribonuclease Z n=1 Tax=Nonlabens xiamenensis TaxID=2341043 RepID=UPI000F606437|nr:ribonuclease Z [Nonlabens xiamenensis]